MSKSVLRIAITVDPEIPVPPVYYGGIERIVDMLIGELQRRGHEVHLFANHLSSITVNLAPYPSSSSLSKRDTLKNAGYVWSYIQHNGPFDVIHSFARLAYLLPLMPTSLPKIQSYQRSISPRSVRLGTALAGRSLTFTSCSASNAAPVRNLSRNWAIVYNGIDTKKYSFENRVEEDAPLIFLGRIERIKGVHTAIEVARRTGRRLLIAGNHATQGEEALYFEREILPQCDDEQIIFIGAVDDKQKNELLGRAAALLFPIEWQEPFGIVMIEALACGTPVIAFRRGSVPEVVTHGLTGFVCDTLEDMINAVKQIGDINRAICRQKVIELFSETSITDQYEELYYSIIATKIGR